MGGYVDTFAYCLLDNHFHILIQPLEEVRIFEAALNDFKRVDSIFEKRYIQKFVKEKGLEGELEGRDLTVLEELLNLVRAYPKVQAFDLSKITKLEDADLASQLASHLISERFRRFLLSYAKSINKK